MARKTGLRVMEIRRRRQWATLAVLAAAAVVLAIIRLPPRYSIVATASALPNPDHAGHRADQSRPSGQPTAEPLLVAWPMELQRDLFEWEDLPGPASSMPVDALLREAQKSLTLQAILLSETPQAVINGRVWRCGQTVEGFRIVRIEPRRILVEKQQTEVEIELATSNERTNQ